MKIYTIGGYNEVGKNMTAVEVDNEIVIFDMGYNMEKVVQHNEEIETMSLNEVMDVGAVPDDRMINSMRDKVKAIVVNHGHLDHCGAIPFLANAYKCPIITTPYSSDIIRKLINQSRRKIRNEIVEMNAGESYTISENLELEFIHITHSIPDTVLSFLRTKEGNVLYANDFKLDDRPTFGKEVDYRKLKKIGEEGIKVMLCDTVHIFDDSSCPSEYEAKVKLENIFKRIKEEKGLIIGTTFASHIARIRSFLDVRGERKVIFLGRSLHDYLASAEKRMFLDLKDCEVYSKGKDVNEALKRAVRNKDEYLIICTGNQGEPNSVLRKIAENRYPVNLSKEDYVIFSCNVIPVLPNLYNRYVVEKALREKGVEIFKNVHSPGHSYREDHSYLLKILSPENVIPCHGETERLASYSSLAIEKGYSLEKDLHISNDGRVIEL